MGTHGAQVYSQVGATAGGGVDIGGASDPELDVIIVYALVRLDDVASTVQLRGLQAGTDYPDFLFDFDTSDGVQSIGFGTQGILFPEGCNIVTTGAADYIVIYEKVNRLIGDLYA
jgi:hypothetical protein